MERLDYDAGSPGLESGANQPLMRFVGRPLGGHSGVVGPFTRTSTGLLRQATAHAQEDRDWRDMGVLARGIRSLRPNPGRGVCQRTEKSTFRTSST